MVTRQTIDIDLRGNPNDTLQDVIRRIDSRQDMDIDIYVDDSLLEGVIQRLDRQQDMMVDVYVDDALLEGVIRRLDEPRELRVDTVVEPPDIPDMEVQQPEDVSVEVTPEIQDIPDIPQPEDVSVEVTPEIQDIEIQPLEGISVDVTPEIQDFPPLDLEVDADIPDIEVQQPEDVSVQVLADIPSIDIPQPDDVEVEVDADASRAIRSIDDVSTSSEAARRDTERLDESLDSIDGRGPRRAARALNEVESEAGQAEASTEGLAQGLAGLGGALAIGGLALFADDLGEQAVQIRAISQATGLATEDIQRLQAQGRIAGFDLDIGDFAEFLVRLGEIRQQALAGEEATIGAQEALSDLGFDPSRLVGSDLPVILDAISQIEDQSRRAFALDEVFGGTTGEIFGAFLNQTPEVQAAIRGINVLTAEQIDEFALLRAENQALGQSLSLTGAAVTSSLIGPFSDLLPLLSEGAGTLAEIANSSPAVRAAIAGTGTALTALTAVIVAQNVALAIRAALSGPVGWAALGVAAAVGLGVGAYTLAVSDVDDTLAEPEDIGASIGMSAEIGARAGTREGGREIADAVKDGDENTLRAITPGIDCLNRDVNAILDALTEESASPEDTPPSAFPGPSLPDPVASLPSNATAEDVRFALAGTRTAPVPSFVYEGLDLLSQERTVRPDEVSLDQGALRTELTDTAVGRRLEQRRLESLEANAREFGAFTFTPDLQFDFPSEVSRPELVTPLTGGSTITNYNEINILPSNNADPREVAEETVREFDDLQRTYER